MYAMVAVLGVFHIVSIAEKKKNRLVPSLRYFSPLEGYKILYLREGTSLKKNRYRKNSEN